MKKLISIILSGTVLIGTVPALAVEMPIINDNFEESETSFNVRGQAEMEIVSDIAHSGTSSMLVSGRGGDAWNGVNCSIMNNVKLDETYNAQMYVKAAEPDASFTVKITFDMEDANGADYPQVASAKINGSEWTLLEGSWKADYNGNLKALNFDIETGDDGIGKSFYVDDVFLAHSSVAKPVEIAEDFAPTNKNLSYSGIVIPDDISETVYLTYVEKLMALGIINGYEDNTFKPDNNVTRAEYLTMLLRLLRMNNAGSTNSAYNDVPDNHWAKDAIIWATDIGICDGYGDGNFGPEDNVTYAQAVKMLMSILGYAVIAENNGSYPNDYMQAATGEDIYVKGASDINAPLTRAMTAELLSHALDVSLYLRDGKGNYTRSNNETLLTQYYDGDIDKGYVSASNDISIDGSKAGIGIVIIDGEEYKVGLTRAEDLVGYNVEYIYESEGGERTLLYIEPLSARNEEFVIDSRDIESYSDYRYEYEIDNGSRKFKRISKNFTLIYNGKTLTSGYSDELMIPDVGSVRLVGESSDNFDKVYITNYDIYVVSSVNKTTGYIYDVNNTKLDFSDDSSVSFINPDGSEGSIGSVRKDDVIHVMSTPGESDITVKILRGSVTGGVSMISDETIRIDDTLYDLSQAYKKRNYEPPKLNTTVTAYLDINGDIVYIKDGIDSNMEVGYLLSAAILESGDELQIRYLTSTGSILTAQLADNVRIDGISFKSGTMNSILKAVQGYTGDEKTKRRIFRYILNSDKEMLQMDFPRSQENVTNQDEANEGKDTLHIMKGDGTTKFKYKSSVRTFYNSSNGSFAIKPDAVVFSIPAPGSQYETDYDEYEIKNINSIWNDTEYKVLAYSIDCDTIFADFAVIYTDGPSTDSINSHDAYVITKVYDGVNSENEEIKIIEVYDGSKKSYALKNSDVWNAAIETNEGKALIKGDIVRFDTDANGEISNLTIADDEGKYDDYFFAANGYLFMKEDGYAFFTKRKPTSASSISADNMILIPLDQFKITIYNKRTDDAYEGVADEIIDYKTDPDVMSKIYITMSYENAISLICVTEE